jgi:hypothetical protein
MKAGGKDVHTSRREFEKGAHFRKEKCQANVPTVSEQFKSS